MAGARGDIKAGAAYVELYVKNNKFLKGLRDASKRLQSFGSSIMKVGAGFAAAGGAILGTLGGMVLHFAKVGDDLDKMSLRTGVAAGSLAQLGFAAEQSGTDLQAVEKGLSGLSRSVFDFERGGAEAKDAFAKLGVSMDDLKGKTPEDQLQLVSDRLAGVADASTRGAVAQKLLGRAGRQLLPMVENLRALREEAKDLGLEPSPGSIKSAADLTDAINRMKRVVGAAVFELGSALAPTALKAAGTFVKIATTVNKFVKANKTMVVTIAKIGVGLVAAGSAIAAIGAAVSAVGIGFAVLPAVMAGLATVAGAVVSVFAGLASVLGFLVSPIALVMGGLIGLTIYWAKFTSSGQAAMGSLWKVFGKAIDKARELIAVVRQTMGGIMDALASGDLALAGEIAILGLRVVIQKGMDTIASLIGGAFGDSLSKITSQITGGDFAGAWNTVVLGMSQMWETFSNGLVTGFTNAAKKVIQLWRSTVDSMANYILKKAGEGGVFGAVFEKISGVDVKEELDRNKDLKSKEGVVKQNIQDSIGEINAELKVAIADGDQNEIDRLNEQLDAMKGNLADLEGGRLPDIFDQVANGTYEDPATAAMAAKVEAALDAYQSQSDSNVKAATDALGNQVDGSGTAEVQKLEGELEALLKKAGEARKKREEVAADDTGKTQGAGDAGDDRGKAQGAGDDRGKSSIVTSSAAALVASVGSSNSPISELKAIRKELQERREEAKEQAEMQKIAAENGGGIAIG